MRRRIAVRRLPHSGDRRRDPDYAGNARRPFRARTGGGLAAGLPGALPGAAPRRGGAMVGRGVVRRSARAVRGAPGMGRGHRPGNHHPGGAGGESGHWRSGGGAHRAQSAGALRRRYHDARPVRAGAAGSADRTDPPVAWGDAGICGGGPGARTSAGGGQHRDAPPLLRSGRRAAGRRAVSLAGSGAAPVQRARVGLARAGAVRGGVFGLPRRIRGQ